MKILLVHQNFPGQFRHLGPALAARGHEVLALTDEGNNRPGPIRLARYRTPGSVADIPPIARDHARHAMRGLAAARAARQLRERHNYVPDVILGHIGWGETLFLGEIWPEARMLAYAELMYRTRGHDVGFDPEFPADDNARISTLARSAHLIQAMVQADAAIAPTRYQADSFPPNMRDKITVIHDGIDTERLAPRPASLTLPGGRTLRHGDEVLSYVARSLEPYRGFHVFMRALPAVLAARPELQVVIVGGDGVSYGRMPDEGTGWRQKLLGEMGDRLDLSRIHFTGRLAYGDYVDLLHVSRCHTYLTYPFVLSWSLMEAMAADCQIIASDTAPVREMIQDGVHGRLVPFPDSTALAQALLRALAPDPQAASLGAAARAHILARYDLHLHCLPRQIEWIEAQSRV